MFFVFQQNNTLYDKAGLLNITSPVVNTIINHPWDRVERDICRNKSAAADAIMSI